MQRSEGRIAPWVGNVDGSQRNYRFEAFVGAQPSGFTFHSEYRCHHTNTY